MIDPRAERAWRALPLRLCVSHDEWHHAKADRSSQSDSQQREQHLDIEPHLTTLPGVGSIHAAPGQNPSSTLPRAGRAGRRQRRLVI